MLQRAEVEKIISMPIFDLKEFESVLRTMVASYDKKTNKSVIQYLQQTLTISYSTKEINKVFGIPNQGQELTKALMSMEERKKWLRLISMNDLTKQEWEGNLKNIRGLKKVFIANEEWRCIADLVKRKLTVENRILDIALWMLPVVD